VVDKAGRAARLEAVRAALEARQRDGRDSSTAVDVFGLAEREGVEVRFLAIATMEGMYVAGEEPTIILPSDRPAGRQAFSCAHELGHHLFGHGTRLDAMLVEGSGASEDGEEQLADIFAAFLLMPKAAVSRGFRKRGWNPSVATASEILRVANWLGVGYSALISQLAFSLDLLPRARVADLKRLSPRKIAASMLGSDIGSDVVITDSAWTDRPIDIRAEDLLALPFGSRIDGDVLKDEGSAAEFRLYRSICPGRDRVLFPSGAAAFVRVSRRGYEGLNRYRFLSDPDYA
jgi:Zn-dependent peptidase ImmA (M78 family)